MRKIYKFRGLPCSIQPDEKLWCVTGYVKHGGGSGVLEWCYDEEDAKQVMAKMKTDKWIKNPNVEKFMKD